MDYIKTALAILSGVVEAAKKLKGSLSKVAAFFLGKWQGRIEQRNADLEASQKASGRAGAARARYRRGELRDEASRYHLEE